MTINTNCKIQHEHFGIGTVTSLDDLYVYIDFPYEQNVVFQRKWVLEHCRIIEESKDDYTRGYQFPPLSFLSIDTEVRDSIIDCTHSNRIIELLSTKHNKAAIVETTQGASVTQYLVSLHRDINLKQLDRIKNILAKELSFNSIRIVSPMPCKGDLIAVEVPNHKAIVPFLRYAIENTDTQQESSALMIPLGMDIKGKTVFFNLMQQTHLLVGGMSRYEIAEWSNGIITSLLYLYAPTKIRMILIDTKGSVFNRFQGVPYLLTPVVTNPHQATSTLSWLYYEMKERIRKLSDDNIDSVDEYNNRQLKAETILPHILVIIDDITDLLNSKTLDFEEYIYHIIRQQKKTGIHLMLCSKFARSDSFTRMLTYRIPFQISFKAPNRSSKEKGALRIDDSNSLLGRGDALYRIKKISDPIRLQTFCVNFGDIEQVVTYIRETNKHFVPETLLPTIESIARKQFSYSEEGYNDKEVKALLNRIILSLKEPTNDMKDSNQITSKEIEYTILHMSKPGYDTKEVDDYLDYLVQEVRANESKKPFDNEKYTQ